MHYLLTQRDRSETWHTAGQLRKATFWEYCWWPTGLGKTPWPLFGLIQLVISLGLIVSAAEGVAWFGAVWGVMIDGALVLGTWMNHTGRWR